MVAYSSQQLKVHEKNYSAHDLDLLDMVFTLKIRRHDLYEVHSYILSDHMSLQCVEQEKVESQAKKIA